MKVSRRRNRAETPARNIIGSYTVVMLILIAFIIGLLAIVALELLLIG